MFFPPTFENEEMNVRKQNHNKKLWLHKLSNCSELQRIKMSNQSKARQSAQYNLDCIFEDARV